MISIGVRLAAVEPRIVAAGLFAGSLVPAAVFDSFGSTEKTLHANLGGHPGVPRFELDSGGQVLRPAPDVGPFLT